MRKTMAILFFISMFPLFNVSAQENRFHVYGALGFAYSPSSIRFAVNDIEAGLLGIGTNGSSIGVLKLFREDSSFAGFGLAFRFTNAIGFHGSVGKSFRWANWIRFRAEVNGEVYTDSFTQGNVLVGLEFPW